MKSFGSELFSKNIEQFQFNSKLVSGLQRIGSVTAFSPGDLGINQKVCWFEHECKKEIHTLTCKKIAIYANNITCD